MPETKWIDYFQRWRVDSEALDDALANVTDGDEKEAISDWRVLFEPNEICTLEAWELWRLIEAIPDSGEKSIMESWYEDSASYTSVYTGTGHPDKPSHPPVVL